MAKAKTAEQISKERAKRDIREIAMLILDKPMKEKGTVVDIEDKNSIESLMKANTDVKTRILMRMAGAAMNGDIKAAEFIMKYSGNEPAKEANLTVNLPTIIDDMGNLDDDLNVVIRKKKKPEEPPKFIE